jgi:hypothetical protein
MPGLEDGCNEAGSRFRSDSSSGACWFRSRTGEGAMDWRKKMMIGEQMSFWRPWQGIYRVGSQRDQRRDGLPKISTLIDGASMENLESGKTLEIS